MTATVPVETGLPSVFDRGPGFESLTAAAGRGAALGYPFLSVVNDVAGMGLSPVSIQVAWSFSDERAAVSVQLPSPDDVDAVGDFYGLPDGNDGAPSLYTRRGLVDRQRHGGHGGFDLTVYGGLRGAP